MSGPAVDVEGLGFTFPGRDAPTLEDISFSLEAGCWAVLAGLSGSGKSTLLRAVAGLIPHHSAGRMRGSVRLSGRDTRQCDEPQLASLAGLVLQSPDDQLCTTSVGAEIAFGLENLALDASEIARRVHDALMRLDLEPAGRRSTQQLSGGQKQRLLLAAIMAMQPGILLLDEPLSQLDAEAATYLLQELDRLRQAGLTILFVEHRLDEVLPYADRVLVMAQGRLTANVAANDREQLCDALVAVGLPLPEVTQLSRASGGAPVISAEEFCQAIKGKLEVTRERESRSVSFPQESECLLKVSELLVRYPRAAERAIDGLTFDVCKGDRIAVVGPNGSGKSTLLSALAEIAKPACGRIVPTNPSRWRSPGLMLQNADLTLFCNSVREELAFGPRQARLLPAELEELVGETAALLGLSEVLDDPPLALSQGQRLRVAVGALLTLQPQLLLLDEPTTGQDQLIAQKLLDAVAAAVADRRIESLIFSTHDLRSVANYANRVLVLADGKLLADCSPEQLLDDDELLAASRLRRTPLFEVRRSLGLRGRNVAELAEELRA